MRTKMAVGAMLSGIVLVASGCLDLRGCGTSSKLYGARQLRAMGKPTCRRDAECAKVLTCPSSRVPLCEEDRGTASPGYCDCAPTQPDWIWVNNRVPMCTDAGVPMVTDAGVPMHLWCNPEGACGRFNNYTGEVREEDSGVLLRPGIVFCEPGGSP